MFRIYLKTALRNLTRNRMYSFLNIFGLAIGIAACIVILLFVFYEKSFDSMHHRNLYRLNEVQKFPSMAAAQKAAITMFPMGPTLKDEFPEVLNYSRVQSNNEYEMTYGEKRVFFPQTYFVDTSFLRMFDFSLLQGDRAQHDAIGLLQGRSRAANRAGDGELSRDQGRLIQPSEDAAF